jgi:3-oxoacyl-[acyl-carrier-protein] synthase II
MKRLRGECQPVVVTGMGVVSPVGVGWQSYWKALLAGQNGVGRITRFDPEDFTTRIAAEVQDFNPEDYLDRRELKRMDRFTQFAVIAAKMAVEDSKLDISGEDPDEVGVIIGSGIGGIETMEEQGKILHTKGPNRVSPFFVPMMISNMASGQVAISLGAKGPNTSVVTACASSTHALGEAMRIIRHGEADVMLAGGSEAAITPLAVAGFCSMKAMSTQNDQPERASRPFDAQRDGFVMGEGSAVLVLESLEHAKKRGAHIYAQIAGYGATADAYHIVATSPDGEGAARAMKRALADGDLEPCDVDYINAHGTSTQLNDSSETTAIRTVFGEHAEKIAISSTKSMTGHLLGAAGAIEAVASILAIIDNMAPPTINFEQRDPACDLDYVPNQARSMRIDNVISNSFGFGGHNAVLAFKRFEG